MRRIFILIGCQAIFTCLQAYLISKISWIGKVGIATVHQDYALLRSGWKTFFLFFGIQLVIILTLAGIQKKSTQKQTVGAALLFSGLALLGLLATYNDFLHTYSHRLLKERFHLGFYLFWTGWIGTCIFFIATTDKKNKITASWPEDPGNRNAPAEPLSETGSTFSGKP